MKTTPDQPPSDEDLLDPRRMSSLKHWGKPLQQSGKQPMQAEATVDCGWGRLLFGQTFTQPERLAAALRAEQPGRRDVALYIRDPQVLIAQAPQSLFLDPSRTYRLALQQRTTSQSRPKSQWVLRRAVAADSAELERIYRSRSMALPRTDFLACLDDDDAVMLWVAADKNSNRLYGVATGVDHVKAFDDPDHGASLWSLAVDAQCPFSGVGAALVGVIGDYFRKQQRTYLDLSVLHDNKDAITFYEGLGFTEVPVYCVKHKNPINEKLFIGPNDTENLNIYARILVDEARRRGIIVEVLDASHGYFRLSFGGRSIVCRESLSELTSAIAMSRCDDKSVTRNVLTAAGLNMPEQLLLDGGTNENDKLSDFMQRCHRVVVKPARGEQGRGVAVDLADNNEINMAIAQARHLCDNVIVEQMVHGNDLRIVVINHEVIAAAVRRPAQITGNGLHDIATLIDKQSRRRAAATAGESSIPIDTETQRCITAEGFTMDSVLPAGQHLTVRKTANLHTGGVIEDVTEHLHPQLRDAAEMAARALDIPVTGIDMIVADPMAPEYAIIEANERPGLANHEPQPTAERFIDLLFPQTRIQP